MIRIYAKHLPYDTGHLGEVYHEMVWCGAPTLRVVRYGGEFFAVEASHRLACAHYLGLTPRLLVLPPDVDGCDAFFQKVRSRLPAYDFPHVLALELTQDAE